MPALHVPNVGGETNADLKVSRSVTDGATTASSTTVTSATAAFTTADVGATISGGSIPAGATISSVTDASTVVVSAAATATATAVSLTIGNQVRFSSPALEALPAVVAPDVVHICVDPDGIAGAPEWMQITAHTAAAGTATVTRATEGSTARTHKSGIEWVHTLAPSELDTTDIAVQAEPPTAPEDGDLWLDTDETSVGGGVSLSGESAVFIPAFTPGLVTTGAGTWLWSSNGNAPFGYETLHTDGAQGDTISLPPMYLVAGTYAFGLFARGQSNGGIATLTFNGVDADTLGGTGVLDTYANNGAGTPVLVTKTGIVIAESGEYDIKLALLTKNTASGGYFALFSMFTLARTA